MKRIIPAILVLTLMLAGCGGRENSNSTAESSAAGSLAVSVGTDEPSVSQSAAEEDTSPAETSDVPAQSDPIKEENTMKVNVGGTEYTAHFYDTKAAEEFRAMLPLTLEMSELNGNEKYNYTDTNFTKASESVGYINKGEILLYGSDCVVLFYDSFSTPYSYTRLGYIDAPDGLESAVGSGSVMVTFSE